MARLNKKQRRQKKWNNKAIKRMKIRSEVKDINKIIDRMNKFEDHVTDKDISNMRKLIGVTITKGLLPKAKFIKGEVESYYESKEDN